MHDEHIVHDCRCINELSEEFVGCAWHGVQQEAKAALPHPKCLLNKKASGGVAEIEPQPLGIRWGMIWVQEICITITSTTIT
jgi:hypothetical protein